MEKVKPETQVKETNASRYTLAKRLLLFFLPFAISALFFMIVFLLVGKTIALVIGAFMLSTLFIFGPEISITGAFIALAASNRIGPEVWNSTYYMLVIAACIAFVDVITAFFLLWNYDLVKKVPKLGPWIEKTEEANRKAIQKSSWRQRFALAGLSIYVMFPVHGSGGLVGTIIGRILGLNRWKVFAAVSMGASIGALWIAALAQQVGPTIKDFFEGNVFLFIGVIVSIVILALVISFILRNRKRKNDSQ